MYRHLKGKPFEGQQTIDQRGRGLRWFLVLLQRRKPAAFAQRSLERPSRYLYARVRSHHPFVRSVAEIIRGGQTAVEAINGIRQVEVDVCGHQSSRIFFAELTMWYFGGRGDYGKLAPPPRPGVEWLKSHDPEAFDLVDSIYMGRRRPEPVQVVDLVPLGREVEGKVRSKPDQAATEVIFINRTSQPVERFWLDPEGKRRSYGTIPPGSVQSQSTFAATSLADNWPGCHGPGNLRSRRTNWPGGD